MNYVYIKICDKIFDPARETLHKVKRGNPGDKRFYISGVSISYFSNRELEKWVKQVELGSDKAKDFKYADVKYHMFDFEIAEFANIIEYDDIWDFYEHVGYDYKKQRWIK